MRQMTKIQNMSIYQNLIVISSVIHNQLELPLILALLSSSQRNRRNMNSSFCEDQSSDLNSYKSYKDTNLSRFLSRITTSLLNEMKRYLSRNKFLHDIRIRDPHKVSLYEDIYAIVTLKEKEALIFMEKGKLKITLKQIAEYTKRSFCTIDERMRKKLYQLTPEQLAFYIENDRDIVFRGNTKAINTDDWPEHLKNHSNQINLDSDNESEISSMANQNRRIIRPIPQKKKFDVVKKISRIMDQPDAEQFKDWLEPEPQKPLSPIYEEKPKEYEDLKNPTQREIFASNVIQKWEEKNLENHLEKEQMLLNDIRVLYNFKKLQYKLINPNLISIVSDDLRKHQQINKQNIRKEQIRLNQKKQKQIRQRRTRQTQIQQQNNRRIVQQQNNRRIVQQQNYRRIVQQQNYQRIVQQEENLTSTLPKRKSSYSPKQIPPQIIQIQVQAPQNDPYQDISVQNNAQKMIQFLQNLVKTTSIESLPKEAQELLKKGLSMMDETKKALQKKSTEKSIAIQQEDSKQKSPKQKKILLKPEKQIKKMNIFNLISSDEDQKQDLTVSSAQNGLENKMMYWFNNDPKIYAEYQDNPYMNGYLMWSEEEDLVLHRANFDFRRYSGDLEKLIKAKSAEMVKRRINFLSINMNNSLRFYIENIFKR